VSSGYSQCSSDGIKSPQNAITDATVGTHAFSGESFIKVSDNTYASVSAFTLGEVTNYIVAQNFGYAIPAGATICGIQVTIEKRALGLLANITDNSIKLFKGGTPTGSDYKKAETWSSTETVSTYGSSTDLWGTTWSPAEINEANFGTGLSVNLGGVDVLPTAQVDHTTVQVFYSVPLPIEMLFFDANEVIDAIHLSWATSTEINNDYFEVEFTENGQDWVKIAELKGAGNSNHLVSYEYNDRNKTHRNGYYRLIQFDFNGNSKTHKIISVNKLGIAVKESIHLSWDFKTECITVRSDKKIIHLDIYNSSGQSISHEMERIDEKEWKVFIERGKRSNSFTIINVVNSEGKRFSEKMMIGK
jgi:hypothetical protein